MTYIKAAITTVLALLILLVGYTYFTFDDKYSIQQAYDSYLKGDYAKAEEILNAIGDEELKAHKLLYQAYVAREMGHFKDSNRFLDEAAKLTKYDTRTKLRLEIYFNQALNGYLENNFSYMEKAVQQMQNFLGDQNNEWADFFQLLYLNNVNPSELANNHEESNHYWKDIKNKIPLSLWMKDSFSKKFTPFWQVHNHIMYLINMGKLVEARQLIEEEIPKSNDTQKDELYLMMARSYIKEAKSKPPIAATPYYKLAYSYYNKVPFHHDRFENERKLFFEQSKEQISALIENQKFEEIDFFVTILDQFDDQPEKQRLSATFLDLIDKEKQEKNWNNVFQLLALLNKILPDNESRNNLKQTQEKELNDAIAIGNAKTVDNAWKAMWILDGDNQDLQLQYKQILSDKIIGLLTSKDGSRTQGFELLKFWNGVEQDLEGRKQFSKELVKRTSTLWKTPGEGDHANQLLVVALQVAGNENKEYITELIKDELKHSYQELLLAENYSALPALVRAPKLLAIDDFTLASPEEINGYLQEAQDAFSQRDFKKANQLTDWVLTLSPNLKKALTIAGLVNYYQGHYKIAERYLANVDANQPEIRKALAVSQILSGVDEEEGMHSIEELAREGVLTRNVYLRLAFGEIVNNQPKKAIDWLNKLNQDNNEVKVGYALAAAEEQNWEEVLRKVSSLSPEFLKLEPIISLELISYINLDDDEKAEQTFDKLMSEGYISNEIEYSQPFNILYNKILNDYTKLYTASLYYEDIGNFNESLRYLSEIKDPSPNVLLRKGELLIELKDYHKAKLELLKGLELVKTIPESEEVEAGILTNLAYASKEQEQIIDTYIFYRDYFRIKPLSKEYRREYVDALIKVRKFDEAYEQFMFMKENGLFQSKDNLLLVETLIHLDDFPRADNLAQTWISEDEDIDNLSLLKLAQLMVITQNDKLITTIVKDLPPIHKLSVAETAELIRLYMYQGNFYQASILLNKKRDFLESTSEGLFGLAQFYLFYTDLKMAMKYAKMALDKDPYNLEIQKFIQSNNMDVSLEKMVEKLKVEDGELTDQVVDYDTQLILIESIIEKAIQKVVTNPGSTFHTIFELRTVLDILAKLTTDLYDIPAVQLYMGQLYYLLENTDDAEEYFNKALDLDISYSKVHQNYGLLYLSLLQLNSAKSELLDAIKFKPYSSDAWFLLGRVNEEKGSYYDSIMAYDQAIKYKPNYLYPYILMGKLQLEVNNPEGAKDTLERSLLFSPDDVQALKLLLLALYNPHLYFEGHEEGVIAAKRNEVEEKLRKLAPEELEKVMAEIKSDTDYKPIRKMSFPY